MSLPTTFSHLRAFLFSNYGKIFIFGMILSMVLGYMAISHKREELYQQLEKELTEINALVKRRAYDRLLQQETQFKAVQQLIQQRGEKQKEFYDLIEFSLKRDPSISAFQFFNPGGTLLRTSVNLIGSSLYDRETFKGNTRAFEMSLKSDRLIVGEALYLKPLQKWIIPFFYALRDTEGNVSLVITTCIDMDGVHNPWLLKGAKDDVDITVSRFYDNDMLYPIYHEPVAVVGSSRSELYQINFPADLVRQIIAKIESTAGKSLDEIQMTGEFLPWINDLIYLVPAYSVLSYDTDYRYHLGIRRSISSVESTLRKYTSSTIAIFLLLNILTLWVLNHDYRVVLAHENDLYRKARQDYLTRLPNRFALEQDWQPMQRVCQEISVFLLTSIISGSSIAILVMILVTGSLRRYPKNFRRYWMKTVNYFDSVAMSFFSSPARPHTTKSNFLQKAYCTEFRN